MNANVIFLFIVGFFLLVVGLLVYSVLIDQPRLRRKLQAEAVERGWTYTPGASVIVTRRMSRGYLISPQGTISESFEAITDDIHWRLVKVAVARKYEAPANNRRAQAAASRSISHHLVWETDDVRIDHGSVLLYLKPSGWAAQSENLGDTVKAGLQSVRDEMIHSIMRDNWGIHSTPVTLDTPELEAKYRVEASDFGAAQGALAAEVQHFLVNHRPPASLLHLGDNGLHAVLHDETALRKFEKIGALVDYGVRFAHAVRASQSAATDAMDSPAL